MRDSKRSVIEKYSEEIELGFYKDSIRAGLSIPESVLVERYFKKKSSVLVIGAGGGREAIRLAKMGYDVVGIDIVPELVKIANENAKISDVKVRFLVSDAVNLPFAVMSFDYVVMFGQVIGHIPKRKCRITALKQIRQLLKPGGILMVGVYNGRATDLNLIYVFWFFLYKLKKFFLKKMNKKSIGNDREKNIEYIKNNKPNNLKYIFIHILHNTLLILKTKYFQVYDFFIDTKRKLLQIILGNHYNGLEPGDGYLKDISGLESAGAAFYHHYKRKEAIEDIGVAGFIIIDSKTKIELKRGIILPEIVRNSANLWFYVLQAG